jgi:hypothetical protein
MTDDLPTARTMATAGFRWHVFCKSCHWAIDADFLQLIADGRGVGGTALALRTVPVSVN